MEGIINLDKPAGPSSAAMVGKVKRLLPRGIKIGHAGTLDPFATGVLLLLVGKATKRCEALMDEPKQYETTIKLGANTATDDPESEEVRVPGAREITRGEIEGILPSFVGVIRQRPPQYSAMKVGGRRAYKLARQGQVVRMQEREVRVESIDLLDYSWPLIRLRIDCGRGTYIRALARDIGGSLQTGGYLTQLRRTRVGSFNTENAVNLEQLLLDGVAKHLMPAPALL